MFKGKRPLSFLLILAVLLGFTSIIVQLIMIREFLNLFMGNELVIGMILSMWMLLTAAGALLGKYIDKTLKTSTTILIMLFFNGTSPVAGIVLITWMKGLLFDPGVMIPLQYVLIITFAGVVIFCLASGVMFTILATHYKSMFKGEISKIYMYEALGSLAGGLLFNLLLIFVLDGIVILNLLLLMNLIAAGVYLLVSGRKNMAAAGILMSVFLVVFLFQLKLDNILIKMKYPGQEVILKRDTPFARLVVTKQAGQFTFYQNGQPVFNNNDLINKEEKIHYAMPLHPNPKNVLLMGGGIDGSAREVLKYNIDEVDYVDPDRWSLAAAEELNILDWPQKINIFRTDLKRFLNHSTGMYDVVILNSGTPNTIGDNRFFTTEFFGLAKKHLQKDGILSIRLPGSTNYLDETLSGLFSSVYKSLKNHFAFVRIVPGNHTYFLASDKSLAKDIIPLIERREIPTEYVNQYYLDENQIREKASLIEQQLVADAGPNTYAHPVVSFLLTRRWLQMINIPFWSISLLPMLLMLILLVWLPPVKLGLFTTGFTASSAEFLLLIAFQITYGFIYQMAGIIIMLFMAGLAAGSGYLHRYIKINKSSFIRIQMILGILPVLIPVFIFWSDIPLPFSLTGIIIGLFTFIIGIITGLQYHLATCLSKGNASSVASSTYGADLAGSAFGMFFIALFIYPLAGLFLTGILLALINFAAAARLRMFKA